MRVPRDKPSGTVTAFQESIDNKVGAAIGFLTDSDAFLNGILQNPLPVEFQIDGGDWQLWVDPLFPNDWVAHYTKQNAEKDVFFSADGMGNSSLEASILKTTNLGDQIRSVDVYFNAQRGADGTFSGQAVYGEATHSTSDPTFFNFFATLSFNHDVVYGGQHSLDFGITRRTSDRYISIGGYGTTGVPGDLLGFAYLRAEYATQDTAFALDADVYNTTLDYLNASLTKNFGNGQFQSAIRIEPDGGLYTKNGFALVRPEGAISGSVYTTPQGNYGRFVLMAETGSGSIIHASNTFGPGFVGVGGSITKPILDLEDPILFHFSFDYENDPLVNDPVLSTHMGGTFIIFSNSHLLLDLSSQHMNGIFSGKSHTTVQALLNGVIIF